MLNFAPKKDDKSNDMKTDDNNNNSSNSKQCQVCFVKYDSTSPKISMKGDCNHSVICRDCFKQHLKIKIREDDCTPWLQCPALDCTANIHIDLIMQHCDLAV